MSDLHYPSLEMEGKHEMAWTRQYWINMYVNNTQLLHIMQYCYAKLCYSQV